MKRFYFIGICGVSMSALALFLKQDGNYVKGYDLNNSAFLKEYNIEVDNLINLENIKWADEVIYSSAFNEDFILIDFAKKLKKTVKVRGQLLGEIASAYENVIAVAGAHGKSTVTSLIYNILKVAGEKPSLHVGAFLKENNKNFEIADKKYFVSEACEYHDNFLYLHPKISVITNVESEHLDYFKNFNNLLKSFEKFAKQSQFCISKSDLKIKRLKYDNNGFLIFDVYENKEKFLSLHMNIGGVYNVKNILFAIEVAKKLKISKCFIKLGLESFKGIQKRFENVGSISSAKVYLDYAHHPKEIASLYDSVKMLSGKKVAVFQPHTFSRTLNFMNDFVDSLAMFDEIYLFKTFPAREKINTDVEIELLKKLSIKKKVILYYDVDALIDKLKVLSEKDVLLIMGAGDLPEILINKNFIWRD